MFARVTQLEVDTLRVTVDDALAVFEQEILPRLREEPGYSGVYVLATDEGRGILMSLWDTAEHARADAESGFYADVLEKYVTLFAAPPGRERYEVRFVDSAARPRAV